MQAAVTRTTETPGTPSVATHLNAGEACTINHSHNVVVTIDSNMQALLSIACALVIGAAAGSIINGIVTFVQLVSK